MLSSRCPRDTKQQAWSVCVHACKHSVRRDCPMLRTAGDRASLGS